MEWEGGEARGRARGGGGGGNGGEGKRRQYRRQRCLLLLLLLLQDEEGAEVVAVGGQPFHFGREDRGQLPHRHEPFCSVELTLHLLRLHPARLRRRPGARLPWLLPSPKALTAEGGREKCYDGRGREAGGEPRGVVSGAGREEGLGVEKEAQGGAKQQ